MAGTLVVRFQKGHASSWKVWRYCVRPSEQIQSVLATATLSKRGIHSRKLPILHVSIKDVNYVGASDLATRAALKTLGELLVIVSTHYIAYSNLTGKSDLAPARELVINKLKMLNTTAAFFLQSVDQAGDDRASSRLLSVTPCKVAKTALFES
ncbi:hypothetical protein BT69DRAFT_1326525 [Atractiella rhizophila]|nr:hypothetical protein BT69DRAFT_1326525 [Atractiella rhizophila]